MRLIDLNPVKLNDNVFIFACPHCQNIILSCKNKVMSFSDQWEFFNRVLGEDHNILVCHTKDDCAWDISDMNSFETLTVTPSIDASASGHWHGFITNGNIITV